MDTKEGLMTGVFLYDDLKKKCPEATIIVLTNVTDPEVLDEIRKKNHVKTLQKLDYTPYEVADLLIDVFTPPWSTQIEEDIQTLLSLPEGWDSHGARHVDPDIAEAAIQLLREVSQLTTPPPAVVPTVRGGIQIEWHTGGIDLEIEFTSPTRMHVAYEKGEEEYEGFASKLTEPNVERIRQFVETLSHPK